jgi:hypothetical protein
MSEEKRNELRQDLIRGGFTNQELMLKYSISEPALIRYKTIKKEHLNNKLKETLVDTRIERKTQIQEIKETFAKLKAEIEKMDKAKNPDGTIGAGALKAILNTMLDVSRELDRQWTGIEKAEGLVADTLIQNDNRSVTVNVDQIGKKLWRYLERVGKLQEALDYVSREE